MDRCILALFVYFLVVLRLFEIKQVGSFGLRLGAVVLSFLGYFDVYLELRIIVVDWSGCGYRINF